MLPQYKGKSRKQCATSYRSVILLSCVGNVIVRILLNRFMNLVVDMKAAEEQCESRSRRGAIHMVFTVRQL